MWGGSGGCKGSVPLALFVFVGPHSVIRLLNAPRPSSFPPPPQPRSTATGGDGDRCGEIQRAVNHRVLAYSRIPFCRSCSSLFADRRARCSLLAARRFPPLSIPILFQRLSRRRVSLVQFFLRSSLFSFAARRRCACARPRKNNGKTKKRRFTGLERYDGCRESSELETRAARFIRETELIEPDARTSEKKEQRGVRREEAVHESRLLMVPVERGRPCCRNRIIGRFVRRRVDKVGRR